MSTSTQRTILFPEEEPAGPRSRRVSSQPLVTPTWRRLYAPPDTDAAWNAWKCNCGPAAVAALLGLECMAVRPLSPGHKQRKYANPTHLKEALGLAGVRYTVGSPQVRPTFGLLFIQWGGPWLNPRVPIAQAYRHTHWIAVDGDHVYDLNAEGGWWLRQDWERDCAPWLMSHNPGCDGTWGVRTAISVVRGGAA